MANTCHTCGKDLALVGRSHRCVPLMPVPEPESIPELVARTAELVEAQAKLNEITGIPDLARDNVVALDPPFQLQLKPYQTRMVETFRIAHGLKSRAAAIRMLLASALVALTTNVGAQTTTVYGPQGQYLGTVNTIGPYTNIYGPQGQWLGMATTVGPTPTPWPVGPVMPAPPMLPTLPVLPAWGQ